MAYEAPLDYIDVATRLVEFRNKYPEGRMRQASLQFVDFGGSSWVVYTAEAYRSPDDPMPAQGTAWEQVPGRTPFTRGSELQNAETAAWGRAIVAALAADTKLGIASLEEVRNRQAEQQQAPKQQHVPSFVAAKNALLQQCQKVDISPSQLQSWAMHPQGGGGFNIGASEDVAKLNDLKQKLMDDEFVASVKAGFDGAA